MSRSSRVSRWVLFTRTLAAISLIAAQLILKIVVGPRLMSAFYTGSLWSRLAKPVVPTQVE
jgi:hypothetical protein